MTSILPWTGEDSPKALSTREVLRRLGFTEVWDEMSDELPAYRYDFGNWQLTATQVTDKYFRPVFTCGGYVRTARELHEICFDIPIKVESFEQGLAWVCYGIRKTTPCELRPAWFEQGWSLQQELPWEREIARLREQAAAYAARPHCAVDAEFFRIARRRLKKLAEQANSNEIAVFRFDGRVLEVSVGVTQVAVQAAGLPWPQEYRIHATALTQLPARTVGGSAYVGLWRNQLCVDCSPSSSYRVAWPLVTDGS